MVVLDSFLVCLQGGRLLGKFAVMDLWDSKWCSIVTFPRAYSICEKPIKYPWLRKPSHPTIMCLSIPLRYFGQWDVKRKADIASCWGLRCGTIRVECADEGLRSGRNSHALEHFEYEGRMQCTESLSFFDRFLKCVVPHTGCASCRVEYVVVWFHFDVWVTFLVAPNLPEKWGSVKWIFGAVINPYSIRVFRPP